MSPDDIEYSLKLYYLGGSTETRNFRVNKIHVPCIYSYNGSYTLVFTAFPNNSIGLSGYKKVPGVVRFEIVSKRIIKDGAYESNFYY